MDEFYDYFAHASKNPGVVPHLSWNTLALFNQQVFKFRKYCSWEEIRSVSTSLEYRRGGGSEIDQDPEGQSRGYNMISMQTVPCHIAGMLALSCWKRKLFPTV